jgi:hypothetical protein
MALAVKRRANYFEASRMSLVFRELTIHGDKNWRHCYVFAKHAAENGSADMARCMEVYKGLKIKERATITPEQLCDLAGVDPAMFFAEVTREYYAFCGDGANLLEAASRKAVVKKTVLTALTTDGWRDRKMLHEHSGFLPQHNGGGIHVSANANSDSRNAVVLPHELTTMEADTMRYTKLLKSTEVLTVEAPAEAPMKVKALGEKRES